MANLNVIPYEKVEEALASERNELRTQRLFNTNFHQRCEIEQAMPDVEHFGPSEQPWILLRPWLDLIMSMRGFHKNDVHIIELPPKFLILVIFASQIALPLGRISEDAAEDMDVYFPNMTVCGDVLEQVIEEKKYFVRLDTCSLKDALIGEGPVKNVKDLWERLATSARGISGLRDLREASMPIYMYLLPWDDRMQTGLEYRVFCPGLEVGGITAISQYKWHSPWYHANETHKQQDIKERLLDNCRKLHKQIMTHPSMTNERKERGFVFDVVEDPADQSVMLIELNDFGALSGCGACLYNWIEDAKVLYGQNNIVEVRVTF